MIKKLTATVLALIMLSGCNISSNGSSIGTVEKDGSYVAIVNDKKISTGIYKRIAGVIYSNLISSGFEGKLAGSPEEKELAEDSLQLLDYYIKASHLFEQKGLSLSEEVLEEIESIEDELSKDTSSQILNKNLEVTQDDSIEYLKYIYKSDLLFNHIYKDNITEKQILDELNNYYYPVLAIPYSFMNDEGEPINEAERKAVLDKANAHLTEIKNGKSFTQKLYEVELDVYDERFKENPAFVGEKPIDIEYSLRIIPVRKTNDYFFPPEVVNHLATAEIGVPTLIESDMACYIVQKVNMEDMHEENKDYAYQSILNVEKRAEFKDYVLSTQLDYTLNNTVIDIVSPTYIKNIYDKSVEEFKKIVLAQFDEQMSNNSFDTQPEDEHDHSHDEGDNHEH